MMYYIEHICGHTGEHKLSAREFERKRTMLMYQRCPECRAGRTHPVRNSPAQKEHLPPGELDYDK